MQNLVNALRQFLLLEVEARLTQAQGSRTQLVFAGPPLDVLSSLFYNLTNNNTTDWNLNNQFLPDPIVVLLVDDNDNVPTQIGNDGAVLSQRCNWDYAISVRNRGRPSLILATPRGMSSWSASIANAMETLGRWQGLNARVLGSSQPWLSLVSDVSQRLNCGPFVVSSGLGLVLEDVQYLDVKQRESIPWIVVNDLLSTTSLVEFVRYIGLPNPDSPTLNGDELKEAHHILALLARLTEKIGLSEAEKQLRQGAVSLLKRDRSLRPLSRPLRGLFEHLRKYATDGVTFNSCPTWYFRPTSTDWSWWQNLTCIKLKKLLTEIGTSKSEEQLQLRCANVINSADRSDNDEPYVVQDIVQLQAQDEDGNTPGFVEFFRRAPRQGEILLQHNPDGTVEDTLVPVHDQPIIYSVEGEAYKRATVPVLSLASFECHGYATIIGAISNSAPLRKQRQEPFKQEVTLGRPGVHDLIVYRDLNAEKIRIQYGEDDPQVFTDVRVVHPLNLEDEDLITITILDSNNREKGSWVIYIAAEDFDPKAPGTRFEALVRAHQKDRSRPQAIKFNYTLVRKLEESYLESSASWWGVIACWSTIDSAFTTIDWSQGILGDVPIRSDIRPAKALVQPPTSFINSREVLRQAIQDHRRPIGEIILSNPDLLDKAEEYLREYTDWLSLQPEIAAWVDCIAIHAPVANIQAGSNIATSDPIALLLSPLHPLRIAWHCHAQKILSDALDRRCPAAGVLDPHTCPSIYGLPLYRGKTLVGWNSFFAVGCNEPHWSLLWNQKYLRSMNEKEIVTDVLNWLGIMPIGLMGGVSESQAQRALNDVSAIFSARSMLRVGIVGADQESYKCADGMIEWCRKRFSMDLQEFSQGLALTCEVYDFRLKATYPTASMLALLSEETSNRVRWFSKRNAKSAVKMDLVLLDQVDTLTPCGAPSSARSPISPGALFRVNIRHDIGRAEVIRESRIAHQDNNFPGLAGRLIEATTALELLAMRDANTSHLQFEPNQQAIELRLKDSSFVAVTSNQIDPACLIRSNTTDKTYLWDYELPGITGFAEDLAGYYLIASPPPSLKEAINDIVNLVTTTVPSQEFVEALLKEISKRGIPVLRRMAIGGTNSRGELGVLLAVRLLQDAFRQPNSGIRLPVVSGSCIHLILPVDAYWDSLHQFQRVLIPGNKDERADLIVFAIQIPELGPTQIKVSPVEVKFREPSSIMSPYAISSALAQARTMGSLLDQLWSSPLPNGLWEVCARSLLAQTLDQSFRIYADPAIHGTSEDEWTDWHERVIHEVLAGQAIVTVNQAGRLLVFDGSPQSVALDMDGDGVLDTCVVQLSDAQCLLDDTGSLSSVARTSAQVLGFSLSDCIADTTTTSDASIPISSSTETGAKQRGYSPQATDKHEASAEITNRVDSNDKIHMSDAHTVATVENVLNTVSIAHENAPDIETTRSADYSSHNQLKTTKGQEEQSSNARDEIPVSPVPPEVRAWVREVFEGFIGNTAAIKRVSNALLRALIEKPPHLPKNFIFSGQPSTGKTELARRMARALNLPFVQLDGRGASSRERLFELIQGELKQQGIPAISSGRRAGLPVLEYPPLVVFIDEVHLVPKGVQESLLTLLEAADRTSLLSDQVAIMKKATFLLATTRVSEVDAALYTRCVEIPLREYNLTEVAEMVRRKFDYDWTEQTFLEIARLGRCVPRVAIEIAKELETEITVSEHRRSLEEHLIEVRKIMEIDEIGLTPIDFQYLSILERQNRPTGEQALLNLLRTVDKNRVIDEVEPFLLRLGFIILGDRGREVTPEGRAYLLERRRRGR